MRCKHQLNPKTCRICNPDITLTKNKFDKLIDDVIKCIANDEYEHASAGLRELAFWCKSAKMHRQGFINFCQYIEREAMKTNPNPEFIRYKLKEALKPTEPRIIVH